MPYRTLRNSNPLVLYLPSTYSVVHTIISSHVGHQHTLLVLLYSILCSSTTLLFLYAPLYSSTKKVIVLFLSPSSAPLHSLPLATYYPGDPYPNKPCRAHLCGLSTLSPCSRLVLPLLGVAVAPCLAVRTPGLAGRACDVTGLRTSPQFSLGC